MPLNLETWFPIFDVHVNFHWQILAENIASCLSV